MLSKLFRTSHGKVDQFRGERGRQSDEQFLAECGILPASDLGRVAIGVRRCVADAGLIDSAFIRPTDQFPGNLGVLPLWDSMDFLDLALRIQRELSVGWDPREDAKVFATPFTVLELIHRVQSAATPIGPPGGEASARFEK